MVAPDVFRYDPDVGYTFIPNLKTRLPHESGGFLLRTNALGFRDDRTPPPGEGSSRRVFVFGDSFTAGDGVANGQRYTSELERLVDGVDVFNFGLSGSGTDQQFIAYKKFAGDQPCDLVIVSILVENIRRVKSQFHLARSHDDKIRFQPRAYFELRDGVLVRFNDPVPKALVKGEHLTDQVADGTAYSGGGRFSTLRQAVNRLGLKSLAQQISRYQPVPEYDDRHSDAWQLMRAILLEWRNSCSSPMLLLPLPLYQHVEETADATAYQQRFRELSKEDGFNVHDVLPDLHAYSKVERRAFRFQNDSHPTPSGHAAIAKSIAPVVSSMLAKQRQIMDAARKQ